MSDMPSRVRLDPDYNGHQRQVVGWASDVPVDDEHGWTEYVRADLSDALLREAMEALGAALLWTDEEHDVADFRDAACATLDKMRAHLGEKE